MIERDTRTGEALALLQAALAQRQDLHLALLRRCWNDAAFMARFHRLAAPLPASDEALRELLQREHWAIPEESGALHWTVELQGLVVGFLSVVEWSLPHRRAEYLAGLLLDAAFFARPQRIRRRLLGAAA